MEFRTKLIALCCAHLAVAGGCLAAFTEVGATALGGYNGNAISGSFADIDNDGDPDLLIQGSTRSGVITRVLFRNQRVETGTATFENITSTAGIVALDTVGWSAGWGDYDGDGDIDVFLGEANPSPARGDLFRNNGDRTFTNVSSTTINDPGFHQNVGWNDADMDGDLDLVIGMEGPEPHELYIQNADGSFTQAGQGVGFWIPYDDNQWGKAYGTAIGDYDGDGDWDIYMSTCRGGGDIPNFFFRNMLVEDGFLHYDEVADANGTQKYENSYGTEFLDFDDDGDLDLYVTGADEAETKMWRNDGGGAFTDVATLLGHPLLSYVGSDLNGSRAVDYDNDGDLDLFMHDHLATAQNAACALFRNDGDWTFTLVTTAEGLGRSNEGGYDSPWADVDLDGDMDFYLATGSSPERLFLNDASTNGNHWLHVRPRTTKNKNTRAIGAALYATIHKGTPQERTLRREANTNIGTFNQSDIPVHFGLGDAEVVDELRIVWPDGTADIVYNVDADQYLTVFQGAASAFMLY